MDLVRQLASQLRDDEETPVIGPGTVTAAQGPVGLVSLERGRLNPADAVYTDAGPYPFVCQTCVSACPCEDSGDLACELVVGPHDGLVAAEGSCLHWHPHPEILDPQPQEETIEADGPVEVDADEDDEIVIELGDD